MVIDKSDSQTAAHKVGVRRREEQVALEAHVAADFLLGRPRALARIVRERWDSWADAL